MNKKKWIVLASIVVLIGFVTLFAGERGDKNTNPKRTITFYDNYKQKTIEKKEVELGESVTLPTPPKHEDFIFIGWFDEKDNEITDLLKVVENSKITARYGNDKNNNKVLDNDDTYYKVVFYDTISKKEISTQKVLIGLSAKAPVTPTHPNYSFDSYSEQYSNITKDLIVKLIFVKNTTTTTKPKTTKPTTTNPTTTTKKGDKYTFTLETVDDFTPETLVYIYKDGKDITSSVEKLLAGNFTLGRYSTGAKAIKVNKNEYDNHKNEKFTVIIDGKSIAIVK